MVPRNFEYILPGAIVHRSNGLVFVFTSPLWPPSFFHWNHPPRFCAFLGHTFCSGLPTQGFSKWVKLWVPGILFLFSFPSSTCACSESYALPAWVVSLHKEYVELLQAEKFCFPYLFMCIWTLNIYFILWVIFQYLFCCSDCSSFDHWELFPLFFFFFWPLYILPFLSLFSLLFQLKGPGSNGISFVYT